MIILKTKRRFQHNVFYVKILMDSNLQIIIVTFVTFYRGRTSWETDGEIYC
jgi:hypothetical protein